MSDLKLDNKTINVLKSFSQINPSMIFKEGSTMTTISPFKNIVARANVPVNFNKRFAIYELNKFLSCISMFNDPVLSVSDSSITIQDSGKSLNYTLASESALNFPLTKDPNFPKADIKFTLNNEILKEVEKALAILKLPDLIINGDGKKITIQAVDMKNPSGDVYKVEVGKTDKTFSAVFKPENFAVLSKSLTTSYEVEVSDRNFAHFSAEDLEYWIAAETTSTFG
jgi:hypothetical protein